MRYHLGVLDYDNYGCRCVCVLPAVSGGAQPEIRFRYDAVCYICVRICVTRSRMLPSTLKINTLFRTLVTDNTNLGN